MELSRSHPRRFRLLILGFDALARSLPRTEKWGHPAVELTDYLRIARAYWRGIVAFVLLGVAVAAGVSLVTPKVYQADASGFVSAGASSNPGEASVGDSLAKSRATSYVDLAKSRATALDVIQALGLNQQPAGLIGHIRSTSRSTPCSSRSARGPRPLVRPSSWPTLGGGAQRQVEAVENPGGKSAQALRVVPVESAALPTAPVSPNTKRNIALGFVLGLMLGLGYAVLRSQLDRRVRTPETIERDFGVTVAGAIPETPALVRKKGGLVPLVAPARARSTTRCTRPSRSSSCAPTCSSWTSTTRRG